MTRSLTKNQFTRRRAILARLRAGHIETAARLRSYLKNKGIFVTVNTVLRDLHAMKDISGTVRVADLPENSLLWEQA